MKSFLLFLLLTAMLLAGCAGRRYIITLNSGNVITAYSKPRLEGGHYVFKDEKGQAAFVTVGRVKEIAPRGMATPRINSGFSAAPTK